MVRAYNEGMKIYIVRHGIAEDHSKDGTDSARELTDEGRKRMKEAAAGFARLEPDIDHIYTSPLVRARQTAEILAESLGKKVEEMKELAPGHRPSDVWNRIQAFKRRSNLLLAGHEPNCSELAAYLLGNVNVEFKKGAICLIESNEVSPSSGILIWHLSPAALRWMK